MIFDDRKYAPLPSLVAFHHSNAPARAIIGPFGSGKSVAAVIELWRNSTLSKDSRYLIIRKTYRMLMDSCVNTFFQWGSTSHGRWSSADMIFSTPSALGGTVEFLFRSADSSEDIEKFRGVEISGAWLDEAQELSQDVKLVVQGRMRYPVTHPFYSLILTSNPCDTEHWIYRDWVMNQMPGHALWRQGADENKHLPESYYKDLRAAFRDRPEMLKRYVEGQWGAIFSGKPVYGNEFFYDMHVSKKHLAPVEGVPIHCGWDFGLSPACIFTQVHPNGQWMALREMYSDDMSIDEFGDAVVDFSNREYRGFSFEDVGDPSGRARAITDEKSCMDILGAKGRWCREAPTNAIIPRLESVKRRLTRTTKGVPRLIIDPRCKRLIDGFSGGYRYVERGNTGSFADVPEKNKYSHIHDALQYIALDLFGHFEQNARLFSEPLKVQGVVGA